jgi:hypothetical protein
MRRTLLAVLCSLACLGTQPAEARAPIAGAWGGSMTPLGGSVDAYTLRVTLAASGRSGTWRVNVCGGRLTYLRARGGTTWFREVVTYGRDVCHGGATDAVRLVPDGLYVHVTSAKGKAYNSAGTLRRAR